MVKRASYRNGKFFISRTEIHRLCSGIAKSLKADHQFTINQDALIEIVARAAGFKSFRDLVLEAKSNVETSNTIAPPPPPEVLFDPLAFTPIGRTYEVNSPWLRTAKEKFEEAFAEAKPSGALAVAVVGSIHGTRVSAISGVATRDDAVIFDLAISTQTELELIDRTTKSVVVFDRVRTDDGSSTWAIAFARRHYDKTVVMLVEDGQYQKLVPINDDKRASQFGWRINVVHLQMPDPSWGHISQPARTASADLNSI